MTLPELNHNVSDASDKERQHNVEEVEQSTSPPDGKEDRTNTALAKHQRQIIRKIDRRLLPVLGLMYSFSLIDRTNIGLALVAGMGKELKLEIGSRYSIIVALFFVMYIVFEIPSNLILPKAGPANWLAFLGISFSVVLIGQGFVHSWHTLAVTRALLGALEAGFLPGCTYLITCWYTRYEVGKRLAVFWILATIAGAFSGIFAYGLSRLGGQEGLAGWQWIFIVEGAITCAICIAGWFLVVDFPAKATFLSEDERNFVIDRINNDRGDAVRDPITTKKILHHLADWKLYVWSLNMMATLTATYSYSYFFPVILSQGFGYSTANAQPLSAPPYVLASILSLASSWIGDRYHIRGPLIAFHQAMTFTGMLITAYSTSAAVGYFGSFLGIGFSYFCVPGIVSFQANNIVSHSKRAVANAVLLIGGGIGGIIASFSFQSSQAPTYTTGVFVTLALSLLSICCTGCLELYFYRCNQLARQGRRANEGIDDWYYTY